MSGVMGIILNSKCNEYKTQSKSHNLGKIGNTALPEIAPAL